MKTMTTTSKCNDSPFHGNDGYTFFQIWKKSRTTTHCSDLEQIITISNNQLRCCNYKEEDREDEQMVCTFGDNATDIIDVVRWVDAVWGSLTQCASAVEAGEWWKRNGTEKRKDKQGKWEGKNRRKKIKGKMEKYIRHGLKLKYI